ncbi:MAG: hypothetical protein JXB88_03190 [Spirochaetales bacterium]|nr:hypothetical protein [Spirochaetales bacterium]
MKTFKTYAEMRNYFGNCANIELTDSTENIYMVYGPFTKEQKVKVRSLN